MEQEMSQLEKEMDLAFKAINRWKVGGPYPFYLKYRDAYDNISQDYEDIEREYRSSRGCFLDHCKALVAIGAEMEQYFKDEVKSQQPSWCIPQMPEAPPEGAPFAAYEEWLYDWCQYLESFQKVVSYSPEFLLRETGKFKTDIESAIADHRSDSSKESLWKMCGKLRHKIWIFRRSLEDVGDRYLAGCSTPPWPLQSESKEV